MDDRGGGIPVLAEPPRTPAGQTATFLTVLSPECLSDPLTPKEEGFFLETSCQDSPRGRALLTRPPVRPWVTAGTGARGFSGLPNENPALTASSGPPQKVWADLQQKPQLTGSQNGLGRCFKPPEKGKSVSACFPPSSQLSVTATTSPHLLRPQATGPAAAARWVLQQNSTGTTLCGACNTDNELV